jgi:hypothetical protein
MSHHQSTEGDDHGRGLAQAGIQADENSDRFDFTKPGEVI